jgi:hypothetical protein
MPLPLVKKLKNACSCHCRGQNVDDAPWGTPKSEEDLKPGVWAKYLCGVNDRHREGMMRIGAEVGLEGLPPTSRHGYFRFLSGEGLTSPPPACILKVSA